MESVVDSSIDINRACLELETVRCSSVVRERESLLVSRRFDPPILVTKANDLCNFPTHKVRDPESFELAFLVQVVDYSEGLFIRS